MRYVIFLLLLILSATNVVAQQPTKEQLELQKKLNERLLKEQKEKNQKKANSKINIGTKWTGTVTRTEIITISNGAYTGKTEIHGDASFSDALPTMYREDETTDRNFTDDKGPGSHKVNTEMTDITGKKCTAGCQSIGQAELHSVVINEEAKTYDIEVIFPACVGTGDCTNDGVYKADDLEAIVSDQPLGTNKDVLSGTETVTSELPGGGTATSTTTWSLIRSKPADVELIVTPVNYDNWLPEPGKNELMKGSVITINLRLQGKNGKPLNVKAESFELRLSNTSKEPGITINYPVEPDPKQLPDLRFLLLPNIESEDEDQFISVGSPDGITGKTYIASYDGGGWTTLTAEAILRDGRHIQGRLLVSNGETDIRIPKRDPNSKIAEAWLKANGNPGETDDNETSKDNNYKGDGLTAYEEYRGVISEGKYKRLDPKKKEVGILARQKDFSIFNEGIDWFKNASDLTPIRFDFDKSEIAANRRLNVNAKSAHDFDQYVVHILDGGLGRNGTLGNTSSNSNLFIPANVTNVTIDWDYIQIVYRELVDSAKPETLKFTLREYLAQTVAHELGHSVNIDHHGNDIRPGPYFISNISDQVRIFNRGGQLITSRPQTIQNIGDSVNTVESGDMTCMLNYYPFYNWGYTVGVDGAKIFNREPLLTLGRIFCTSKKGTGINATSLYFGKAKNGNCMSQIQLKN